MPGLLAGAYAPMSLRIIESGETLFEVFISHLVAAGLPVEDLLVEHARYFALSPHGENPSAFGGLLKLGKESLLRSVVVPAAEQGRGHGKAIVECLATLAAEEGAERLWLLTTDASGFFSQLGWREKEREKTPVSVASTRQFASVCPASAVLMCRALT